MKTKYFLKKQINYSKFNKKSFSTILDSLKNLTNELPHRDALMISSQNIKWTLTELDSYTNAFAKHLIEVGMKPGENFLIWSDVNHSAEIICATLGAWKAGLTVVHTSGSTLEDQKSTVLSALNDKEKEIKGFLFSPYTSLGGSDKSKTLLSFLENENALTNSTFATGRHVIQISHKTIKGMIKFKQAFNYANDYNTTLRLPVVSDSLTAYNILNASTRIQITHGELLKKIVKNNEKLNFEKYSSVVNSAAPSYPVSLSFGLLGNIIQKNYVVCPGTYSLKETFELIKSQKSKQFICESSLLDIDLNDTKIKQINEFTKNVSSVVVLGIDDNEAEKTGKDRSGLEKCFPNAKVEYQLI